MGLDNKSYLFIVDYSSKYPFLFEMSPYTVTDITDHLKDLLALI